ncbi:MAG: methyltransferase domain-containing protein [Thermodesulfobacteriota bacterium]
MKPFAQLEFIQEIDQLWDPVYPYLARHISELYGRRDGDLVEIGPFCGVVFSLLKEKIGHSFWIATFPEGMGDFFRQEAEKRNLLERIKIMETNPSLVGLEDGHFDLAIFRGALFFPHLFQVDFSAIYRILKEGGMALLGGGYGKFTPESVMERIKRRSRDLNLAIGKTEIDEDHLVRNLRMKNLEARFEFLSEGGLWLKIEKWKGA